MTHCIEFYISAAMDHRNTGDFGLAVNLLEVYSQCMKKTKVVRTHGRPARIGISNTRQAKMVLYFLLNGNIRQPF